SSVIGAGVGLAYGAMPMLIMQAVPTSETAAANSFNTLLRSLGTSSASAIATMILAELTVRVGPVEVPSENSFRVVMGIGAGAAVVALVIASFLRGRKRDPAGTTTSESSPEDTVPAATAVARSVRGTVTGTAGSATPTVAVTAHRRNGEALATTVADDDGWYELAGLPLEPVTLVA